MKFKKLNSKSECSVNIQAYKIKWEKPSCSKIQTEVKKYLSKHWSNQIVCEEFRIPGSLLRIDFINFTRKLAVEVSPASHHSSFNAFFHKTRERYKQSIIRDVDKARWLEQNGFLLMEIYETDLPLTARFFQEKYGILI